MEKIMDEFESLIDYINNRIIPRKCNQKTYYRGQQSLNRLLIPKAMRIHTDERGEIVKDYEYKVTNTLIVDFPEEFYNISPIIRLSRIEHHNLPSRLVNISSSPIVALFFSCCALDKDDGNGKGSYIFEYTAAATMMKQFDSDTGKLLSSLSLLTTEEQSELRYDAVMDYMSQIYSHHIVENKYGNCSWGDKEILIYAFRIIFRSIITLVSKNNPIDEKSKKQKLDEMRSEIRRKLIKLKIGNANFVFSNINPYCIDVIFDEDGNPDYCRIYNEIFRFETCSDYYGKQFYILYPEKNMNEWFAIFENHCGGRIHDEYEMLINPETDNYDSGVMCTLQGKLESEYSGFMRIAGPLSILDGTFVQPIMSSDRMISQYGAFMLYGLSSFWDIKRAIRYLQKKLSDDQNLWKNIIGILVSEDLSFLKDGKVNLQKPYFKTLDPVKLCEFLEEVQNVKIIKIQENARSMKENLRKMNVTKATLGRTPEMSIQNLEESLGIQNSGKMKRIGLVACSKEKNQATEKDSSLHLPADELYIGDDFKKALKEGLKKFECSSYLILSGRMEHVLLEPKEEISSYEFDMNEQSTDYRKDWTNKVYNKLLDKFGDIDDIEFVIFASDVYCKYLKPRLNCIVMKYSRKMTLNVKEVYRIYKES